METIQKTSNTICAACLKDVDTTEALKCAKCNVSYHPLCVNCAVKELSQAQLAAWECPACCSKKRKGNNVNTPVRKDSDSSSDNVTQRKRPTAAPQCSSCLSREDLKDIVRREIRDAIRESKTDTKAWIAAQFQEFKDKITDLESSLSFISEQYEDFKNDIQFVKPEIQRLTNENCDLKSSVQELTDRLNQLDQQARASNLEIQCVPEFTGENLVSLVQQLGTTIEYPVQKHEILQCSRISKLNPNNPRPRSILVKLASPRLREGFITANRKFNKTHSTEKLNTSHLGIASEPKSQVYVAEHLTKEIKELHKAARQKAKEIGYEIVWVTNGRVYLRKTDGMDHVWVKNTEVLKNLK